jgi:4-aminobutyrate aminotransferase-like enzyme
VQTGFGRTGDHRCGIEHWGVEPDIMTFAKGIANGAPVGATIATPEVADSFTGLTISTFGGNPVTMAATRATLEVMERENAPKRAADRGRQLRGHLEAFKEEFAFIGDVRGMGLMQAIELVEDRATKEPAKGKTNQLMEAAKRQGLLLGKGGLYGNVIRIAPSLLVTEAEIDDGAARMRRALAEVK